MRRWPFSTTVISTSCAFAAASPFAARSCERFQRLVAPGVSSPAATLPPAAAALYAALQASEARHFEFYLKSAEQHAAAHGLDARRRLGELAAVEAELATAPDPLFRFHSGPPPATA